MIAPIIEVVGGPPLLVRGRLSLSGSKGETTRRDVTVGIAAELAAAGFDAAEEIGRGGFGIVYRCLEHSLDRVVAVKVLTSGSSGDETARFLREQRMLGRLSGHPNIVQVLQADVTSTGRPFLVMPFHVAGSLQQRIQRDGPIPWQEVLTIGVKLAGALAAAHARGIVHRDVTPANVLSTDYGEPQLADFGIARTDGAFETGAGVVTGTPAFLAPEILSGQEPSVASDIYSLAATLFCLLTGHAVFERRQGESMVAQFLRITSANAPQLRLDGVPELLGAAIETAMAPDPALRPTANEFGNRLRDIEFRCGLAVTSLPGTAEPATPLDSQAPASAPLSTTSNRYRPPTPLHKPVSRQRLLDLLEQRKPRRLALIHAPAGYGKTSLAAQWAELLETQGTTIAWLSVDADDNNVVWFLSHLIEGVHQADPELVGDLRQLLEERSSDATRYVLTTLLDAIHDSDRHLAVVIDDWHQATSAATQAALEYLLDHGCHHLQLIVTSRDRRNLPLGRMRVRDELTEIDEALLRFDAQEAAELLSDHSGVPLAAAEIETLRTSTEGWAAGIQLAALSLRNCPDPAEYVDKISGRHFAIAEYLLENVIDGLAPELLEFMMRTSITRRICADLAEALTGTTSGQRVLEEIQQRDLFLRAVDDDLRWFCYHSLFADFLRHRLARDHPELPERLHLRASNWFDAHDMPAEAVDHALAANAPDQAARIVASRAQDMLEQSKMATLLGLVAKLPAARIADDPRLQLWIAWANIGLQRPEPATAALALTNSALRHRPIGEPKADELRTEARLAQAANNSIIDRPTGLPPGELARLQPTSNPFLAMACALLGSVAALHRFDFDEVHRWHAWIAPYRGRTRGPFGILYQDCVTAIAAYEQLDLTTAETCFRAALDSALQIGSKSHAARLAGALLGELLYAKGQFVEAAELLDLGGAPDGGDPEFLMAKYGIGARLAAIRGDLAAAERDLTAAGQRAEHLDLQRLAARVRNERVRLGLPISGADRRLLTQCEPYRPQSDAIRAMVCELDQDSAVRLSLADGSTDRAVNLAEHLVNGVATQNRPRALLTAQLLYGCALSAAGHRERATSILRPVLDECSELDLVGLVIDTGTPLQPVIETLSRTASSAPIMPFLRRLLAEFASR